MRQGNTEWEQEIKWSRDEIHPSFSTTITRRTVTPRLVAVDACAGEPADLKGPPTALPLRDVSRVMILSLSLSSHLCFPQAVTPGKTLKTHVGGDTGLCLSERGRLDAYASAGAWWRAVGEGGVA